MARWYIITLEIKYKKQRISIEYFIATLVGGAYLAKATEAVGMSVYAQQVVSAIAFVIVVIVVIYLNTVLKKFKRVE